MPVVPFAPASTPARPTPAPPPLPFALMAAALMHSEGRLIPTEKAPDVEPATK